MFVNIILKFLFVTVGNRNVLFAKNDSSLVDDFYFLFLHNVRPMDADEPVGREFFFHGFHTRQGQDGTWIVFCVDFDIVFQSFDV